VLDVGRWRWLAGWVLGVGGVLAYNWWLLVPLRPGLMRSPDELFSNLEVTGRPYAAVMQHLDLAAGVLLVGAFLVLGRTWAGRGEWASMLVFAAAGGLGGLFPEVCADGVSRACRDSEWRFELPVSQYVHVLAGIVEFAAITVALLLAVRRTRGQRTRYARAYVALAGGTVVAYPLLGIAYLVNRFGGVMEAVFFAGFTVLVLTQIAERSTSLRADERRELDPHTTSSSGKLTSAGKSA
jgi:Protein of unknown function (DUF998)